MKRLKKSLIKKEDTISGKRNDIVKVTEFNVKPVFPKTGQTVIIKMEIQNVSRKTLKCVPWQIIKDRKILDTGSRFYLRAGDKFNVLVTWTATPGKHFIYGDVDPENVLREPRTKQFNNSPQGVDVRVS